MRYLFAQPCLSTDQCFFGSVECAIKNYWELKGEAMETLLHCYGDSRKMESKCVQVPGPSHPSSIEQPIQSTSSQPLFVLPYEMGELTTADIKKSNVEGISCLSIQLRSIELDLRATILIPTHIHHRLRALCTLLDQLGIVQHALRSTLSYSILER